MLFYRLDGAYSDVAEDATAFSGGTIAAVRCVRHRRLPGPRDDACGARVGPVDRRGDAPVRRQRRFPYVNGSTDFDEVDPVAAAYGAAKFARLVELKATYDPTDLLHGNARVAPLG